MKTYINPHLILQPRGDCVTALLNIAVRWPSVGKKSRSKEADETVNADPIDHLVLRFRQTRGFLYKICQFLVTFL